MLTRTNLHLHRRLHVIGSHLTAASAAATQAPTQVTICGGGNGAQVLVALAGEQKKFRVNVLSLYKDEAKTWQSVHDANGGTLAVRTGEGKQHLGRVSKFSNNPADVIPGSSVIIFAMPAFAHETYLKSIKPFLSLVGPQKLMLGTMPGQGGFDICARDVLKDSYDKCSVFALETLPWACRIREYGKIVDILGTKVDVDMAVNPPSDANAVRDVIQEIVTAKPKLTVVGNILNCTLMNINAVWHPTICFGAFRNWDFKTPYPKKLLFYESVDDFTADKLSKVSNEILQLKAKLEKEYGLSLNGVRHVEEWMRRSYKGDMKDETSLKTCINTNKGYQGLTHAMYQTKEGGWLPDFTYRYFSEDIPMGLAVMKGIAELAGLKTPHLDEVLAFGQKCLGKEIMVNGKIAGKDVNMTRTPQRYGIKSIKELIEKCGYKG